MKKTTRLIGIFVMFMSIVTLMSSCQKNVSNLPGTWRVTSAIIDNDREDDLDDVWTFNTDGTCDITCDVDEYFDDEDFIFYDIFRFQGRYETEGNKILTIESIKYTFDNQEDYSQIRYDLNILTLNKHTLKVSGTVKEINVFNGITTSKVANVTLTLAK